MEQKTDLRPSSAVRIRRRSPTRAPLRQPYGLPAQAAIQEVNIQRRLTHEGSILAKRAVLIAFSDV